LNNQGITRVIILLRRENLMLISKTSDWISKGIDYYNVNASVNEKQVVLPELNFSRERM
jgi:hypothetical protein